MKLPYGQLIFSMMCLGALPTCFTVHHMVTQCFTLKPAHHPEHLNTQHQHQGCVESTGSKLHCHGDISLSRASPAPASSPQYQNINHFLGTALHYQPRECRVLRSHRLLAWWISLSLVKSPTPTLHSLQTTETILNNGWTFH